MRILRFLATSGVVIGILGFLAALGVREALLSWGVARVRTDLVQLRKLRINPGNYARECIQRGAIPDENLSVIESYQLRFLNDTEYVTEVVCAQFKLNPQRVSENSLPMFVKKTPGSSGLFWGANSSAVELEVFGRKRTILVEDEDIFYEKPGIANLGEGPATICAGYGFECCAEETAQGVGDQLDGVTDCPRSCYDSCVSRPIVLSFSSDPFMDPQTRTAEAKSGEPVTFSYVADLAGAASPNVIINFGDGTSDAATTNTGTFSHSYTCNQAVCEYVAQLVITDEQDRTSADIPVTKITLLVTR